MGIHPLDRCAREILLRRFRFPSTGRHATRQPARPPATTRQQRPAWARQTWAQLPRTLVQSDHPLAPATAEALTATTTPTHQDCCMRRSFLGWCSACNSPGVSELQLSWALEGGQIVPKSVEVVPKFGEPKLDVLDESSLGVALAVE